MDKNQIKNLEQIKEFLKPTLLFIPRGIKDYTDHGIKHTDRVEEILHEIISLCNRSSYDKCKFNNTEEYLLFLTALVHDLGCIIQRENHASISGEIITKYISKYDLLEGIEPILAQIVKAHSGDPEEGLNKLPKKPILVQKERIRLRYISAIFRLADACDIKIERCPGLVYNILEPTMTSRSKKFWEGHRDIISIDFNIKDKKIIVLVKNKQTTKIIIDSLQRNFTEVKEILRECNFPFLKIETEVADWIE